MATLGYDSKDSAKETIEQIYNYARIISAPSAKGFYPLAMRIAHLALGLTRDFQRACSQLEISRMEIKGIKERIIDLETRIKLHDKNNNC